MTTIKAQLGTQELDIQVNDDGLLKTCLTPHSRETLQQLLTSFTGAAGVKFASLDIEGDVIAVGVEQAVETHIRQDLRSEFSDVVVTTAEGIVHNYMDKGGAIDYDALSATASPAKITVSAPALRPAPGFDPKAIPNF